MTIIVARVGLWFVLVTSCRKLAPYNSAASPMC